MIALKTKRNLLIFSLVALSIGWVGVGIDRILPEQTDEETLGMAVWVIAPLFVVVLLRLFGGDGWKDAGLYPRFRGNWIWYLVSILIFPAVTLITLAAGGLIGWIDFSRFESSPYFSTLIFLLGVNFLKNIFEESVWRGYLAAKLIHLQINDWAIYAISGLVWGLWHLPYYLEFLPGEMINSVLPVSRGWFAAIAVVNMLVWTVMFTELFRLSDSIWPVVLLHAVEDSVINHLVIDGYIYILPGKELLLSPITGILPTLLFLLIGLGLRGIRMRKGRQKI